MNLIALCAHHHEDYGHPFADLLFPQEWHLVDLEWESFARPLREKLAKADPEAIPVRKLDALLSKGLPENPYPYAPR